MMMIERLNGYTKSDEGVKEFSKLGLAYPTTIFDKLYEQWLDTTVDRLDEYGGGHTEKEVLKMTRIRVRNAAK